MSGILFDTGEAVTKRYSEEEDMRELLMKPWKIAFSFSFG